MVLSRETKVYRQDEKIRGTAASAEERETLIRPYLPSPKNTSEGSLSRPVREFLRNQLDLLVFTVLHLLFSIYIRIRRTQQSIIDRTFAILYYHHRAPELIKQDVKGLSKLPRHLSVILELKGDEHGTAGLERLIDDAAEISAWCSCAGIPFLSIYEKTGRLKPTRS